MQDFWRSSGYAFVKRNERGHLQADNDFLRGQLRRPELAPVEESCASERALHAVLLIDPRAAVDEARLAQLRDTDAQDSYRLWLLFRDRLLAAGSLEEFYQQHFLGRRIDIPPVLLDQVAQVILRGILDGAEDALLVRAAELFFRVQSVAVQDDAVLLGDAATIEMHQESGGFGAMGRLLAQSDTPMRQLRLEVLNVNNAIFYWMRDERFDTVLDMSPGREALAAFCRVMEKWVRHFFAVEVRVTPLSRIDDDRWIWHLGLDSESSAILNDLYRGNEVDAERLTRLVSLFRLEFANPAEMRADVAGRPVYLGLAMNAEMRIKMKPQNLLLNLPLARLA